MSALNLMCTGIVSLLSIPCIHYPNIIVNIRASFTVMYLIIHCIIMPVKTLEMYAHHLITISLILNTHTNGQHYHYSLGNSIFFLEFSAFLIELSKIYNNDLLKYSAKAYWVYDRVYRFPVLLLDNSHVLSHVYVNAMFLCYIGIYWSYKMIKFKYSHNMAIFTLFILNGINYY